MNPFEFYNPVRVIFEPGGVAKVGAVAEPYGKNVLLVSYGENTFLTDVLDKVTASLQEREIIVSPFFEISPNPTIEEVGRGVELCKKEKIDLVIGVGGGSVMDAAKAIAAGVYYEGDLWNMVASSHKAGSTVAFPSKALPTVMVPTMAATGSEMNCCAVLSNEATKEKSYVWDDCLFPQAAVVDSELTFSLPAYQTACGAADIFSHALEFYINGLEDTPVNYPIQEGLLRTVLLRAEEVLENPNSLQGRTDLQWASIVALCGISQPGNAWTPMHQVGHVLSARFGVAHGASLALVMPSWMRKMWPTRKERYLEFATRVMDVPMGGEESTILAGIDAFESFLNKIGIATRLDAFGIKEEDLDDVVADVRRISFNDDDMLPSHTPLTAETIREILTIALTKDAEKQLF
ncbi:NADH-dependent alcohol dehydrogenase [Fulvitalea axinellae]|uniref:NADH-dependent alcohol dehydrogenase n=1 Tax=Fulvitalea axinellae TaxID=1182444 RepID=A0AAU9CAJ3_9BACT|nr:NADH-dependent alcohol dehydrogenase [Fulvitalea axinellae]